MSTKETAAPGIRPEKVNYGNYDALIDLKANE